ncbi:MAG TPA: FAD-binding oxidoreductase [Caulobacteraceae bacterium]|nr:FAD-binding oxidoreductase [Caulobacteraceae bacterium]
MAVSGLVEEIGRALGPDAVLAGEAAAERARTPWARLGTPAAIVRPRSTEEVSWVLEAAHAARQGVVPWGGLTGLVDGACADGAVALSLERMNVIEQIDPATATMRVQAGCILQTACEAAEEKGLLLPLDLGARGSATIGGNISTNAGGNRVLRYGMMRDMVLGLEAVLADGAVIQALNPLMKNNAGYDVKQLFIGSEGTLGVVTRAVLRLRPKPTSVNVAFLAVDAFERLPALLRRLERDLGGTLSAFEVMWPEYYDLVTTAPAKGRAPVPKTHAYYVLVEAMGAAPEADAERFTTVLGEALADGDIADAAIAQSVGERAEMWHLRDDVVQVARNAPIFTFDVSLRISDMEAYVERVRADLKARWGDAATMMVFGHLGDGNLHLIPGVGDGSPEARRAVEEIVYGPLRGVPSSVSAEHGIGLQKRDFLSWSKSGPEIALMRTLKAALDPRGILNPGKVLA